MALKANKKNLFILIALLNLNSCATFPKESPYVITSPPDLHLSFTGRGTVSGPMLMSAMGPAGIAVGLAIDVGIGKDIERFGFTEGLNVEVLFASTIRMIDKSSKLNRSFFFAKQQPNFQLHKIGFVEFPEQENLIIPAIELRVQRENWQKSYRYPEDFRSVTGTSLPGASLEQLKSQQSPARELLQQALAVIIQKSMNDWLQNSIKH